jgi:tetratricopeptide (TPR) repeat protein
MRRNTSLVALLVASTAFLAAATLPARATSNDPEICRKTSGLIAIAACTRAIESGNYQGRALAELHADRATEYQNKGELDRAIADHGDALRADPTYTDSLNNRGTVWLAKGDYDRAMADFDAGPPRPERPGRILQPRRHLEAQG